MISWLGSFRIRTTLKSLRDLAGNRIRLLPLMVIISIVAFLFEGLAIYLIFPLIEILAGNDPASVRSGPLGWLGNVVATLPDSKRVAAVVAAIVGCILIKSIITFLGTVIYSNATQHIGNDIRQKSFLQMLNASPLFLKSRPSGTIVNTLTNQTWAVSQGLEEVAKLIMNASAVTVFLVLLLSVSWTTTLAILIGVLIAIGAAFLVLRYIKRIGRKAVEASEDMTVRIVEGLNGHTTLRLFNGAKKAEAEFNESSDKARGIFYRMFVVSAVPQLLLEVLFAAIIGVALIILQKGNVSEVLVLIALLLRMQPHAVALVNARSTLASITGGIENLEGLRDASAITSEPLISTIAPTLKNSLSLSNVGFSYPTPDDETGTLSKPALVDVTLSIPAGRVTALVGHSGAGKSTIAMLLCRLAEPETGLIHIDDVNLAECDASSWRERCAFVPQNVFLFNQSIRENIKLGKPQASNAEIETIAREANAHDFIVDQPQGYDTLVGDRGENLSGGQRQRIALARALLRQPDLLILDEATNSLDPRAERLVSDALNVSDSSRTTVVIAHRLSTIQHADQVIVLDEGRVVEVGTPKSLVGNGGHFEKLFENEINQT